jgi:hypothetical protein
MEPREIVPPGGLDPNEGLDVRTANEHTASARKVLEQEGSVQSKPEPRNSTLYSSIKPIRKGTPPPPVLEPKDDDGLDDEILTESGTSTGPVRFPYKEGGARNESNRQVPGTTGNRSGTTTANGEPEQNRGRRTPLAGRQRVVHVVRQAR